MLSKVLTYFRLGITNIMLVALYRMRIKLGQLKKLTPITITSTNEACYFEANPDFERLPSLKVPEFKAFGWLPQPLSEPPNWQTNIVSRKSISNNQLHWTQINDFDNNIGDIKTVWEISRFNWLFPLTLKYLQSDDLSKLEQLNYWLSDWSVNNPVNQGINWKCGQECSIRVMHLAACSYLLNQHTKPTDALADMIFHHLERIAPTISYAMAQDNNHGTSEAAALFIGSLIVKKNKRYHNDKQLDKWLLIGRNKIENRCQKLIANDGCFSQNSVNYHRLMLDTLSLVEFFRQQFNQPKFSKKCYNKVVRAVLWLSTIVDKETGKTPILGLNDGAQLLPVTACDYLDYRPSVQWAYELFLTEKFLDNICEAHQLSLLFPTQPSDIRTSNTQQITLSSDYCLLNNRGWRCYLRTPTATFRPAQCDALHLDVWHGHENILIGTGSYSYNCEPKWQDYFPSIRAQNSVQFDTKEQMPKLSRFLYSDWIKAIVGVNNKDKLSAHYTNSSGHQHRRSLTLSDSRIDIEDDIKGFNKEAVLRWHLPKKDWKLKGKNITSDKYNIEINATVPITKVALVDGWQSRYYLKKELITVIEITVRQPTKITTILSARE